MTKNKLPVTQAVRVLKKFGVQFKAHPYDYLEGGGTARFAEQAGVDEHRVIKTLLMEDDHSQPMIVLMHGDKKVSVKNLARHLDVKSITPCEPKTADKHSGYQVGGTSPFGTRKSMPVYCEASIAELDEIFINGGKRGFIISMQTQEMLNILTPELVSVATE